MSLMMWGRNTIDFWVRDRLRWRRGPGTLPYESKDALFSDAVMDRVSPLVNRYRLENWREASGRIEFAASMFYLEMTERAFAQAGVVLPSELAALECGPGTWFYVRPLLALLECYRTEIPRSVTLDGVELDAYAICKGFRTRMDWAVAYMGEDTRLRYLAMDLPGYRKAVDVAFMYYPFLFARDSMRWGLPQQSHQPLTLLRHVAGCVKPNGWLFIANLGEAERERQHELIRAAGLEIAWWGAHESPLFTYKQRRYMTVIRS